MWWRRRAREGRARDDRAREGRAPATGRPGPVTFGRVFAHRTVISGERPALAVVHDDEGDWIVLDRQDAPADAGDFVLCGADELLRQDPTLREAFANVPAGYSLAREHPGGPVERTAAGRARGAPVVRGAIR